MAELFNVRAIGPLASHVEGFCAALVRLGYAPRTARDHCYVLVDLSRWLAAERLEPSELTSLVVERFLRAAARGLSPLVFGQIGATAAGVPRRGRRGSCVAATCAGGPGRQAALCLHRYLCVERRLAPATVRIHEDIARRFLSRRAEDDRLDPSRVSRRRR